MSSLRQILIFDSGLGGLSIASAIKSVAPDLIIHYANDAAFFPYGEKEDARLLERIPKLMEKLDDLAAPDAIIMACNTASTLALEEVRARLAIPVIGVVPAIKPAAQLSENKVIGILATPATVRRVYTDQLVSDFAGDCQIIRHGSSELVTLAERKMAGGAINQAEVSAALQALKNHQHFEAMDVLVLACTHFPLVRDEIAAVLGDHIALIDSGEAVARQTLKVLENTPSQRRRHSMPMAFVTGGEKARQSFAQLFLQYGYSEILTVFL